MNREVLFYCSSKSFGGLEMNFVRLAHWLTLRGNAIVLLVQKGSPMEGYSQKLGLKALSIPSPSFPLLRIFLLSNYIRRLKPGVIITGFNRDLKLLSLLKHISLNGWKLIYQQQMQLGIYRRDIWHTFLYRSVDVWISPLPWLANEVFEKTLISKKKVAIVPLCIDVSYFTQNKLTKTNAKTILGLEQEGYYFGVLGRFDRHKGQLLVLEAFISIASVFPQIRLLFMGEPTRNASDSYYQEVLKRIGNSGFADRVLIRPFDSNTLPFFRALDVFVMATHGETFGMVTIEAMCAKVPVIGSRSGGTVELLDNGNYGLLFDSNNIKDLSEKMSEMVNNYSEFTNLAENVSDIVSQKFSHHKECEEIEKIINSLV